VTPVLSRLQFWFDESSRSGPSNMAVDEWLLETAALPVLRVYRWAGDWGSLGYFGGLAAARATFPGVEWVRRWTGGGLVDHRDDWTYTLAVPKDEALAHRRGAESYRAIHSALVRVLRASDAGVRLSSGVEQTGAQACFANPVEHDVIDDTGRKLAGAGQRRTRCGLLHQGSVAGRLARDGSLARARALAAALASRVEEAGFSPDEEDLARREAARYADPRWTERR
jgi:lipoate-protein ligase A